MNDNFVFQTQTWTHLTDIPEEFRGNCIWRLCCVGDNIYLVGGWKPVPGDRILMEYNPRTNTWRNVEKFTAEEVWSQCLYFGPKDICTGWS